MNDGGPQLSEELSRQEGTVYLVLELDREPDLAALLDEFWEDIFDQELAAWTMKEENWPPLRSLDMINQWFDEEPLTQFDVDLEGPHRDGIHV